MGELVDCNGIAILIGKHCVNTNKTTFPKYDCVKNKTESFSSMTILNGATEMRSSWGVTEMVTGQKRGTELNNYLVDTSKLML